jgi:glutaredoxin
MHGAMPDKNSIKTRIGRFDTDAMADKVTIHSKPGCNHCVLAKRLLQDNDIPFREVVYDPKDPRYENDVQQLRARTNHPTFPQIFVGTDFIGGADELLKEMPHIVTLSFC